MVAYRIDDRDFNVGDIIYPQNLYQQKLNENKLLVEKILEANRPLNKPVRNSILMLFEEFKPAHHHWTLQFNAKFYMVEIVEDDILHTGDYNKAEELFVNINNPEISNNIALEYWSEKMSDNPTREFFVNSASVIQIISNQETERINEFVSRFGYRDNSFRKIEAN